MQVLRTAMDTDYDKNIFVSEGRDYMYLEMCIGVVPVSNDKGSPCLQFEHIDTRGTKELSAFLQFA